MTNILYDKFHFKYCFKYYRTVTSDDVDVNHTIMSTVKLSYLTATIGVKAPTIGNTDFTVRTFSIGRTYTSASYRIADMSFLVA